MAITQKSILIEFTRSIYGSDAFTGLPPKREFLKYISTYATDDPLTKSKKSQKSKKELSPELLELKTEYTEKLGKKPSGPKANDIEWLKSKISKHEEADSDPEMVELSKLKAEYTEKLGKKPSGPKTNDIEWLRSKISKYEDSDPEMDELIALKAEYTEKLGKKPKGPKANDMEWLKSKISESDDSDPEMDELLKLKTEYTEKFGKKPKGPKANDIEWLKSKIAEANQSESSDDESDEEGAGVGDIPSPQVEDEPQKFTFEGVEYTKTLNDKGDWIVEDEDENEVGEWIEKGSSGYINWEEQCWEEIHHDHEDYTGEE